MRNETISNHYLFQTPNSTQINLNFYVESCNDYSININEQRVIRGMRIGMLTRLKKTDYLFQTSKQINLNFL